MYPTPHSRRLATYVGAIAVLLLAACGDGAAAERRELEAMREQLEADRRAFQEERARWEHRSGVKVNLPSGTLSEIDPSALSLVLRVTATGTVVVEGMVVAESDLDRLFRSAFERDPNTQVLIESDKDVPHGLVVQVIERVKLAGLTRLAIATKGKGSR